MTTPTVSPCVSMSSGIAHDAGRMQLQKGEVDCGLNVIATELCSGSSPASYRNDMRWL